jgi:hypothetical protein
VETFALLTPVKRATEDARIITLSIALSAVLWAATTLLVALLSAAAALAIDRGPSGLPGPLWSFWVRASLTATTTDALRLVPGTIVNVVAVAAGLGVALALNRPGGRLRSLSIWHLVVDLNPNVWNWYFQDPVPGRLYLVTLKSGHRYVGQVKDYAIDPRDTQQDFVLTRYSRVGANDELEPVTFADDLLLSRDAVDSIEKLPPPSDAAPLTARWSPTDDDAGSTARRWRV